MTERPGFASDNHAGAHPSVLAAVVAANEGHAAAYGADPWTTRAMQRFREHFGAAAHAFPVFNGTGANVLCLEALTQPWQAVVCSRTAHLHVDECGAPERAGRKLLVVDTPDGRLTPELVEPLLTRIGDEHVVQPRVISITQSTELGTVYPA
jgi:threonine aldolase